MSTVTILLMMGVLLAAITLPISAGIEIPIIFYILNAEPEVLSVTLYDDQSASVSCIDPGTSFTVDVKCRDNNTAADIMKLSLILFSSQSSESAQDSDADHYSFVWTNSSGFQGQHLEGSGCIEPTDLDGADATWRFCASLDKTARADGSWTLVAIVEDEAESARMTGSFGVNKYAFASLNTNSISLSGEPGTEVMTGLVISYKVNYPIKVGARASVFVGEEVPSFTLQPGDFCIDDDTSTGSPESGLPILTLSSSRQVFVDDLMGSGQIQIYVFVNIPDPFMDQDYEGSLVFDVRSR